MFNFLNYLMEKGNLKSKLNSTILSKSDLPEDISNYNNLEVKKNGSITYLEYTKKVLEEAGIKFEMDGDKFIPSKDMVTKEPIKVKEEIKEETKQNIIEKTVVMDEIKSNTIDFNKWVPHIVMLENDEILMTLSGIVYLIQKYNGNYSPALHNRTGFILPNESLINLTEDIIKEMKLQFKMKIVNHEFKETVQVINNKTYKGIALILKYEKI